MFRMRRIPRRNLVPVKLVRDWMREAVERLYARQPQLAGAVAADGGRPAEDLLRALPGANWKEITGEFFLDAVIRVRVGDFCR